MALQRLAPVPLYASEDMDRKQHWEAVSETKQPSDVSWFQALPSRSLELIASTGAYTTAVIIDIGGGDAMLVDALLDRGYRQLCPRTPSISGTTAPSFIFSRTRSNVPATSVPRRRQCESVAH